MNIFKRKNVKDYDSGQSLLSNFKRRNHRAKDITRLIRDVNKVNTLVSAAQRKAEKIYGPGDNILGKIKLLIEIIKDYISGAYTKVPTGSIITSALGLLYFVTPLDAVFDAIPVLGLIDDVAVLAFVIRQVNADLEKYKIWKAQQKTIR